MTEADLLKLVDRLNSAVCTLLDDGEAMAAPSVPLRGFATGELGVLRLSTWLYALFYESGKDSLGFLLDSVWSNELDVSAELTLVRQIRTYLQHHLKVSTRDDAIRETVELWLAEAKSSWDPDDPSLWTGALDRLASTADQTLDTLAAASESAFASEASSAIASQWTVYRARAIPTHIVDSEIERLAVQFGLDNIDAKALRDRHLTIWRKSLQLINVSADPLLHLQGLIERELLALQDNAPLPVRGEDVMDAFGIPPGPEVGQIMRVIKDLYSSEGGTKEELVLKAAQVVGRTAFLTSEA